MIEEDKENEDPYKKKQRREEAMSRVLVTFWDKISINSIK
jgi:uncharacterized protein with ATP-grasp and redox domains